MMSVLEYAKDLKITVAEVIKACEALNITINNGDDLLDDEAIIALDNYIATQEESDDAVDSEEILEKYEEIEEVKEAKEIKTKVKPVKVKIDESKKKDYIDRRKAMYKHREKLQANTSTVNSDTILYHDGMNVSELAEALGVNTGEIIKKLMLLGTMATINQVITFEMAELLVLEYNKKIALQETTDESNFEMLEVTDNEEDLINRAPIVTIMGHVDHGKTTLLDYIRKTSVTSTEAGGITQNIGAYQAKCQDKLITFIDTPGHEAFTQMRARGASITDIVIIVVAADDGIKPQTKEAIDHAKAAGVPIIIAINKMDKPNIDPERVLSELTENGITPEEWGGDTMVVKISAITGDGIEDLLERVLMLAELADLKANPKRYALGTVIESKMDKNIGSITTLLVQNGTLRIGDPIVVGCVYGKVRTLKDSNNNSLTVALPSMPVELTGLGSVVNAGDKFMSFESEKQAKSIADARALKARAKDSRLTASSLDDLFSKIKEGIKEIKIILKADVQGSVEALKSSLEKINVDGVVVTIIRSSVGTITENDVLLASTSKAIIIGFNVRPTAKTKELASEYGVEIKLYNIIYQAIEELELAMKGLLDPVFEEVILGTVTVRKLFKFSKIGIIAGSYVNDGVVKRDGKCRLIRDGIVLYDGKVASLQREKDQVKEVKAGIECGLTLENYLDIKENDVIEVYELKEKK